MTFPTPIPPTANSPVACNRSIFLTHPYETPDKTEISTSDSPRARLMRFSGDTLDCCLKAIYFATGLPGGVKSATPALAEMSDTFPSESVA